uniref:Uncharacterized protein n=1 Tax=Anguilla anguilla TaxID=7936 RepID=A0A0E9WJ47_ANGAN
MHKTPSVAMEQKSFPTASNLAYSCVLSPPRSSPALLPTELFMNIDISEK